jgi:hypothetical protein
MILDHGIECYYTGTTMDYMEAIKTTAGYQFSRYLHVATLG